MVYTSVDRAMNPLATIFDRLTNGEVTGGPYECQGCGETYPVEYHVCPCCGGYSVESEYDPVAEFRDDPTE
ncbi:hypothetical protein [Haloprofundus salilacus]|uniref:hypothetical protein n=1 Tax=Haloprofundus salilacus TaxID=2876190 RepID=UPI001CCA2C28|nr:hypothetical protein [Haloprofundus salilacus]